MNIESLVRIAVEKIKLNWGLPKQGFVAGGSIANLVWELVSGKKAIVNDIDVFIFDGIVDVIDPTNKKSLFRYQEKESQFWEDYNGIRYSLINKDFYTIESSEHVGMFNNVKYKSNKADTDIILRSFDINATKVGYSIEEDKCYWTPEFEEFLKTGELKVCNLMTPSHTAIRIVKKRKELDCKLTQFELDLLRHSLEYRFSDIIKVRFKDRYYDIFNDYIDDLKENFIIKRDFQAEEYVKTHFQEEVNLYYLQSIIRDRTAEVNILIDKPVNDIDEFIYGREVFDDSNIRKIHNSQEFLFYMRNIFGKNDLPEIWSKLYFFFTDKSYIDCQPTQEDLNLISRLGKYAPNSIDNLKGKKLSEQIKLVKWILEKFEEDPIVAISILEKHKLSQDILDEHDLFLLELSVRKQIVNDTRGKVNKVLDANGDNPLNNTLWWLE
jgi:hypothetical protein